jgi:ABC-2 type transport system permease protein
MIRAIRAELLKLRTTRLPWGLLAFTIGLTSLHTLLFDSNAGGTGHTAIASLATHTGQSQAIGIPAEVLLLATVLGVIVASGEFRHRTATNTYLAIPNRAQVLAAKAIAAATLGLLFGLVGAAATTAIGLSFTIASGHHIVLSTATILRYAAGATVGAALLAAAGVGLGSLLRPQIGAIIAIFVWGFVVEQTVGGASATAQRYLPYTAAASLAGTNLGSGTPLPFAAAAALVAAVAALISLTAARTALNADIT